MQGDCMAHSHHLVTLGVEGVVALGHPFRSSPEWGVQGLLWILPLALSMGSKVLFFTVVLSREQPDSAWLACVSW